MSGGMCIARIVDRQTRLDGVDIVAEERALDKKRRAHDEALASCHIRTRDLDRRCHTRTRTVASGKKESGEEDGESEGGRGGARTDYTENKGLVCQKPASSPNPSASHWQLRRAVPRHSLSAVLSGTPWVL